MYVLKSRNLHNYWHIMHIQCTCHMNTGFMNEYINVLLNTTESVLSIVVVQLLSCVQLSVTA